jgi:hypothetical protein
MPYSAVAAQLPAVCSVDAVCTHPCRLTISARPVPSVAALAGVYSRTLMPAIDSVVHDPVAAAAGATVGADSRAPTARAVAVRAAAARAPSRAMPPARGGDVS